jgi:hypothetical protein
VTPYRDPEQRKRYKRAARLRQKLKNDGKRVDGVRSRDLMRFVEKPRSISRGLVRSSGTAEKEVPSVLAQVEVKRVPVGRVSVSSSQVTEKTQRTFNSSGTVERRVPSSPAQAPTIVAKVPVQQKQRNNNQAIATMPSAICESSASVPSAKYVDPELRRLQKELVQLQESLHPWKIGSAQWVNVLRQLVDKGSEIRTLIQRSKRGRGIAG